MAFSATFIVDSFHGSPEKNNLGHLALHRMLRALTGINCDFLRAYPNTPMLYEAGVHYELEPPGREEWQDIPTTLARKNGDCEDLACWRAAELIVRGHIAAEPTFLWKPTPTGANLYHIQVRTPTGIEDPSRVLGMGRHKPKFV